MYEITKVNPQNGEAWNVLAIKRDPCYVSRNGVRGYLTPGRQCPVQKQHQLQVLSQKKGAAVPLFPHSTRGGRTSFADLGRGAPLTGGSSSDTTSWGAQPRDVPAALIFARIVRGQILVPSKYRANLRRLSHGSSRPCHLGSKKSTQQLLREFYWPGCFR